MSLSHWNAAEHELFGTLLRKQRAGIYIRRSEKSEGRSKSREEQLHICRQICERYGFEIDEARIYYEEEGQKGEYWFDDGSGYHPKPYRPELTRLVNDIKAGKIDVVVVWRSDRLYRDAGVCDALMKLFRQHNIRFFSGPRDMDVNTASGLYGATTEAATNRKWRDSISEDIKRDQQFKAEMGLFSRNPTCLGFRSKGKGTQDVEYIREELTLALRVFTLFVLGEENGGPMGITAIANRLMDEGIVWPKGRRGHKVKTPGKIHTGDIKNVLTNCMYIGRWRHNGREYECDKLLVPVLDERGQPTGKRETAVPLSLYEAAGEKLARADRPGKRSLSSEHLLTGLAVCGRCGRPLEVHFSAYKLRGKETEGEPREPRRNFQCNRKRGTRPCPPGSIVRVQEPVLDRWALEELAPLLALEIEAMRTSAGREADLQALADLERQLKEARGRETKKLALLVDAMDAEQFGAVATQLRAEREALERKIGEIKKRLEGAERRMPDLSQGALRGLPTAALKEAFTRSLQWVAVCKEGVVALTTWGVYIGAAYRKRDPHNPDEQLNVNYLCAPDHAATLSCLSWLPDPQEFVRGRRDALGRRAERLSDAELLPGLLQESDEEYLLESEVYEGYSTEEGGAS